MELVRMTSFSGNTEFVTVVNEKTKKNYSKWIFNIFLIIFFALQLFSVSYLNKVSWMYTLVFLFDAIYLLISVFYLSCTDMIFLFSFSIPYLTVTDEGFYYLYTTFFYMIIFMVHNEFSYFLDWQMYYFLRIYVIMCSLFATNLSKEFIEDYKFASRLDEVELFPEYSLKMTLYISIISTGFMIIANLVSVFSKKIKRIFFYNQKMFFLFLMLVYSSLNFSSQCIFLVVIVTSQEYFLTTFFASIIVSATLISKYKSDLFFREADVYHSDDTLDVMEMLNSFRDNKDRRSYLDFCEMSKSVNCDTMKDILMRSINSYSIITNFNKWKNWERIDMLGINIMIFGNDLLIFCKGEVEGYMLVISVTDNKVLIPDNIIHFYYLSNLEYIIKKIFM